MKFSTTLARTLLLMFISVAVAEEDFGLCCLCDGCSPAVSGRGDLAVNNQGYTCTELILDMADTNNNILQGNAACNALKGKWYNHCCNPNHNPVVIHQEPTKSPGDKYPQGPNGWCDLCAAGNFPGNPTTIIAVLDYPLVSTCRDLHWRAQKGYFEDRLCRPLRNFYVTPCGCNVGSSGGIGGAPEKGGSSGSGSGSSGVLPEEVVIVDESKDASKMHGEVKRGNLGRDRQRALKGSHLR
jgi:hypothetical protein